MSFAFLCCGSAAVENVQERYAAPGAAGQPPSAKLIRNASKQFVLLANPSSKSVSAGSANPVTSSESPMRGSKQNLRNNRRKSSLKVKALDELEDTIRNNNKHVSDRL